MVGPTDPTSFENPTGGRILDHFALPVDVYDAVFDFGCGCGRQARQLLLQQPRPRRYVGIDANREMIEWCRTHLSPVDGAFQFHHHDVYSPSYAPENTLRLAAAFPVEDHAFSLVLAHSVFTHLYQSQGEYYLHEMARILRPRGLAFTSWFLFDRTSFPFLGEGRSCLFIDEAAPSEAVIYDRGWLLDAARRSGLAVWRTVPPPIPGHQWSVFLTPRSAESLDEFPLGEEGTEWLCGATARPMASPTAGLNAGAWKPTRPSGMAGPQWPEPPALSDTLEELAVSRRGVWGRLWLLARAAARWLRR